MDPLASAAGDSARAHGITPLDLAPSSFRLIADSAPVPMWVTALDRRRHFVNRAYLDFVGVDYEAALVFDWREILHPDDAEQVIAQSIAGEASLRPFSLEGRFRGPNGDWRWLRSVSQPCFDADGVHSGFIGVAYDLTETKLAELAALRREQQLSAYIGQTMAGFAETDLAGRFTLVNDRFCQITGYTRDQLLARTMQSITHPDDLPANLPLFERAVDQGEPYAHEKRYVRPDGSQIWVHNSVSVIRNPGGVPSGVLAVSIDVTARKQAEQRLSEAEERLRLATEGAGIGTWDWDLVRMRGSWSHRTQEILGMFPEGEVTPEDRFRTVHPEDRERVFAEAGKAIRQGREFATEYRIVRPDGGIRWISSRGVVLRDPDGRAVRTIGIVQDVTDRREVQVQLEALNRSLEDQVAARTAERDGMWRLSQDLLLVVDRWRRIVAVNPRVQPLLGYLPEAVTGERFDRFIHPEDRRGLIALVHAAARGPLHDVEARLVAADGEVRSFVWSAAPEGGLAYVVGRDVSEDRARQRELLATQEALRQSQKLEAIGQLTGGVAHDFNNLLSPIIGSLDLLRRRGIGDERTRRLIEGALESADRARVLVQRLLAFARRQPLEVLPIDLETLLTGLAGLLRSTVGPMIELRIDAAPGLPPVMGDTNQLEMAVLNLAVNARDAMPYGGRLRIEADPVLADDDQGVEFVRLRVSDTGLGMDADTLARAVEPFFSTKGVGRGTGLGLSMVEGLCAQLGGSMSIESAVGEGTTVSMYLPAAAIPVPAPAISAPDLEPRGSGLVLLVDDEPMVRASTAALLTDFGFSVVEVESAAQALARLRDGLHPDCVVSDHLMPGTTGAELAAKLRAERPALPVLILSGYAGLDALGPDQPHMSKPFNAADLVRRINRLIAQGCC